MFNLNHKMTLSNVMDMCGKHQNADREQYLQWVDVNAAAAVRKPDFAPNVGFNYPFSLGLRAGFLPDAKLPETPDLNQADQCLLSQGKVFAQIVINSAEPDRFRHRFPILNDAITAKSH